MFKKFMQKLKLPQPVHPDNYEYLLEQKYEELEFHAWDYSQHELGR